MSIMTDVTAAHHSSKRKIFLVVSATIILLLTFILEGNLNRFELEQRDKLFGNLSGGELLVKYDEGADYTPLDENVFKLPTYIKSAEGGTFHAFGNTYFSLSEGTELRTLIFRKNRIHLQLLKGQVIFDSRLGHFPATIQTGDALISPFQKGVFQVKPTEVKAFSGQALVGVYEDDKLSKKILVAKGEKLQLETLTKTDISIAEFTPIEIDQLIAGRRIFDLTIKGQRVIPSNSQSFVAGLTKTLTFNDNKKNFISFYPYAQKLLEAQAAFLAGENGKGGTALIQAAQVFDEQTAANPAALKEYTKKINEYAYDLIGLSSRDQLNPIKTYIIENHLVSLEPELKLPALLSYIEDADNQFDRGKAVIGENILSQALKLTRSWGDDATSEQALFVSQTLDNLLERQSEANFETTYQIRIELAAKMNSDHQAEYSEANIAHVKRLQKYSEDKALASEKIKDSTILLVNSLSRIERLQFDDFVETLNIEALTLLPS